MITHFSFKQRSEIDVQKLLETVPDLKWMQYLRIYGEGCPTTRTLLEQLVCHFPRLKCLVVYNLYARVDWAELLRIPAILKLTHFEMHRQHSFFGQGPASELFFGRNEKIEEAILRYSFDFSLLSVDEPKLVKIDAVFSRDFILRFVKVSSKTFYSIYG